ncbi:MAG: PHP domain-containing protein [Bacteroidales bacterium]
MKIDFHVHTYHSYDCLMKPEKILKTAKRKGLDGIVICDHNTIKGGLEVKGSNNDSNFTVIVGAEIKTDAGDITGIHLIREVESQNISDVIKEIREQRGKIILNHPFKDHDLSRINFSEIDYIEGYNSRLAEEDNRKAVELAIKYGLQIVAGSDAHFYGEIGNSFTVLADFESFMPLKHEYKPSKYIFQTLSQYIKSYKERNFRIFVSASAVQLKHSTGRIQKSIKNKPENF